MQSQVEDRKQSSHAVGIVAICVAGVGLVLILTATLVAGLNNRGSFVGPTDSDAIAISMLGGLFLLVSFGLACNAIATPFNRRNGIIALCLTMSPLVLAPVSLLVLDAFVT